MIRIVTLSFLLLPLTPALAQRHVEVGIASGVTHYYGDLGNLDGQVQWNSTRPGLMVTFRDFLNNKKRYITRSLTTEARLCWFRTGYEEADPIKGYDYSELKNRGRGIGFRNDLVGLSGHLVLNAYRQPYQPLFHQRFFMYFHIGLGVYYGRPRADLFRGDIDQANRYYFWNDGTVRDMAQDDPDASQAQTLERDGKYETDLYEWQTEGGVGAGEQGRRFRLSPWHMAMPIGAGVRVMATKQMSVGLEFSYIMFMNDRIDDVSDRYATYAEIDAAYAGDLNRQQLARYISDPTRQGTNGEIGTGTSRRGNPGLLDTISFFNFEVSYKFKRAPGRRSFLSMKRGKDSTSAR